MITILIISIHHIQNKISWIPLLKTVVATSTFTPRKDMYNRVADDELKKFRCLHIKSERSIYVYEYSGIERKSER
jgi:hypothetical protein